MNPVGKRAFARYVHSPVPESVENIVFEGNDWFELNPEPVCYFFFSAGKEDLQKIATKFRNVHVTEMFSPGGPPWFQPALMNSAGRGQHFYRKGKRGREYLWIDESGTRAYFLLFGV